MSRPRDRRRDPEPAGADVEAVVEAKYRLLHRLLKRYAARTDAQDPDGDAPAETGSVGA